MNYNTILQILSLSAGSGQKSSGQNGVSPLANGATDNGGAEFANQLDLVKQKISELHNQNNNGNFVQGQNIATIANQSQPQIDVSDLSAWQPGEMSSEDIAALMGNIHNNELAGEYMLQNGILSNSESLQQFVALYNQYNATPFELPAGTTFISLEALANNPNAVNNISSDALSQLQALASGNNLAAANLNPNDPKITGANNVSNIDALQANIDSKNILSQNLNTNNTNNLQLKPYDLIAQFRDTLNEIAKISINEQQQAPKGLEQVTIQALAEIEKRILGKTDGQAGQNNAGNANNIDGNLQNRISELAQQLNTQNNAVLDANQSYNPGNINIGKIASIFGSLNLQNTANSGSATASNTDIFSFNNILKGNNINIISGLSEILSPTGTVASNNIANQFNFGESSFSDALRNAGYNSLAALHPADQIRIQIEQARGQGREFISLQLEPKELGKIDVRFSVNNEGKAQISIVAESQDALNILQRDVRGLERSLQESGLKLDRGDIGFSLKENNQDNGGQEYANQQGNPQYDGNSSEFAGNHNGNNGEQNNSNTTLINFGYISSADEQAGIELLAEDGAAYNYIRSGGLNIRI